MPGVRGRWNHGQPPGMEREAQGLHSRKFCCSLAGSVNSSCQKMFQPQRPMIKSETAAASSLYLGSGHSSLSLLTWKPLFPQSKGISLASTSLFLEGLTQWGGCKMKVSLHLVWQVFEGEAVYTVTQELRALHLVYTAGWNANLPKCAIYFFSSEMVCSLRDR